MNNFPTLVNLDEAHGWPRIGRQFYDVWACLGDERVQAFLDGRTTAQRVVQDARAISESYGRPDAPVPVGGVSRSPVFDPALPPSRRLRVEHEVAMSDLYYGRGPGPTFDEVLDRVQENAASLNLTG
jgi:hypothetical protein